MSNGPGKWDLQEGVPLCSVGRLTAEVGTPVDFALPVRHAARMVFARTVATFSAMVLGLSAAAGDPPADEIMASAVSSGSAAQSRAAPFAEGDLFPDLAFPSLEDGTPTRLSDFRGHKVMLHIFASW